MLRTLFVLEFGQILSYAPLTVAGTRAYKRNSISSDDRPVPRGHMVLQGRRIANRAKSKGPHLRARGNEVHFRIYRHDAERFAGVAG